MVKLEFNSSDDGGFVCVWEERVMDFCDLDSNRKDMGYPIGYPIPSLPWDGTGMGWDGGTVPCSGVSKSTAQSTNSSPHTQLAPSHVQHPPHH